MNSSETSPLDRSQQIQQQLDREFMCGHEEASLAVKQQQNGLRYFRQCQQCGKADPLRGADLSAEEKAQAIPFDKEIKNRQWQARSKRASELYQSDRKNEKEEFDRWYQSYLATPEWRVKRDAVLKRAGFVCEGCLENRATEVHHLTYARVGREMLFDLVAVCADCHHEIHHPDSTTDEDEDEDWDPASDESSDCSEH